MFGSISPDPAVPEAALGIRGSAAPLFALAPDDSSDDAGRPPEAPHAAPSTSIRADVGRALADGLARAFAGGDNREARRILAALSALTADDVPEVATVSGTPVIDLVAERRKRGER